MLGQNIKILREFYGESQMELADKLNVSPSFVSHWEKGRRIPKHEDIEKMAEHYRISLEELTGSDLSCLNGCELKLNVKKICLVYSALFPIIETDGALQDENFQKGYYCSLKIMEKVKKLQNVEWEWFENAIDYYEAAWLKAGRKEALANGISLILLLGNSLVCEDVEEMAEHLKKLGTIGKKTLKKDFLVNPSMSEKQRTQKEELRKEFIGESGKELDNAIRELKEDLSWADLGDYFIAIRYLLGLKTSTYNERVSNMIGWELLETYLDMGNKYARRLVIAGRSLGQKTTIQIVK